MLKSCRLLFVILFPLFIFPQEDEYQLWNNLEIEYSIFKKTDLVLETSVRTDADVSKVAQYFSDFSVNKKYNAVFSYAFGYRYSFARRKDVFENRNRMYADCVIKQNIFNTIKITSRTRFQAQKNTLDEIVSKIRQKLKLNYNIDFLDLDMYISYELFYVSEDEFQKSRYSTGFKKSMTQKIDLYLNCMMESNFDPSEDDLLFALRTKLKYSF